MTASYKKLKLRVPGHPGFRDTQIGGSILQLGLALPLGFQFLAYLFIAVPHFIKNGEWIRSAVPARWPARLEPTMGSTVSPFQLP